MSLYDILFEEKICLNLLIFKKNDQLKIILVINHKIIAYENKVISKIKLIQLIIFLFTINLIFIISFMFLKQIIFKYIFYLKTIILKITIIQFIQKNFFFINLNFK